jgi:hypothetical protein
LQLKPHLRICASGGAASQDFSYLIVCRLAFKISRPQNAERKKGLNGNEEVTILIGCGFGAPDRLFETRGHVLTTGKQPEHQQREHQQITLV